MLDGSAGRVVFRRSILVAVLAVFVLPASASAAHARRLTPRQSHTTRAVHCLRAKRAGKTARRTGAHARRSARTTCAALSRHRRARASIFLPVKSSTLVGYVSDFGGQSANDASSLGSSIFVNALTGTTPGATYTTADASKTVTLTDVPISKIDAAGIAAITPFDTLILYQVCDIAGHPKALEAINTFLTNGGKVMIFDADRCAEGFGGTADYSAFLFPFSTNSPGPKGASGSYVTVVPSTLTSGLSAGPQELDSVGDANVFTAFKGPWCASITGENFNGVKGFVEATAQTPSGGLVIYEGEDFWFTFAPTAHLRLVFDDMLEQSWAPAGLPCTIPASGITLAPPTQSHAGGETATVTATVTDIEGKPVEGVEVKFEVTSGPNAGTNGTATTNASGEAKFTYAGKQTPGTDLVDASFVDSLKNSHTSNEVEVVWEDAKITATGDNVSGTEGAEVSGTVATFTDPDSSAVATDYVATIEWGDGTTTSGTVSGSAGSFSVSGNHTYAEENSYPLTVVISDIDELANSATTASTASIGDASLGASGVSATSPMTFSGVVANLTDANALGSASDFTVTIEWGDGNSSGGTVSGGGGSYAVSGNHTYASTGTFEVTVKILDDGGSTAEARSKLLIFASTAGGSFVIGDGNATLGTPVTFWGAQWWKDNSLSGGGAPAAFKGFANSPATPPACGTDWSTGPGNSSGPPAAPLPAFIAVIVASHVEKAAPSISGDTTKVVVVKTDPGYAPNPGHSGTGMIVAVICG
jgi:hypothetical protein